MSTQLDPGQVIKGAYDETSQSLKVSVISSSVGNTTVIESDVVAFGSINGSGGARTQITASTSALIAKLIPNEQTGVAMDIYTGAAASEVLLVTLAPGQDNVVDVDVPAGTRLSIRAHGASAPASGSVYLIWCG